MEKVKFMTKKSKFMKIIGICLSLTLAFGVKQGCGTKQEDILAEMEDAGITGWLCAGSRNDDE